MLLINFCMVIDICITSTVEHLFHILFHNNYNNNIQNITPLLTSSLEHVLCNKRHNNQNLSCSKFKFITMCAVHILKLAHINDTCYFEN